MEPVTIITGRAVPLDRSDVDTDQIIPSDWLKRVERTGFGDGLFSEWREDPEFVLNLPQFGEANILVAGPNFGVGSSREHAVWSIMDYGFKAVITPRFGDIFRNNCRQERPRAGRGAGRGGRDAAAGRRGRPDRRDHRRRREPPGQRARRSASTWSSRSTTPPGSASCRASTTSASPSATRPTITAFEATRPAWMPSSTTP